jgi:hypothetical protein
MKQQSHQSLSFKFKDGANQFGELSTAFSIYYAAAFYASSWLGSNAC